ncbi:DinB family protein [Actinosynnema pretiosum subsp. pretiosum]|uniref:Mini-circle protein n=2 Tax=Actinosynnema TaxID=40566 RepID=C6WB69_ACTMD|nr:DinB family protein [Actinosynnema mirum]ACU39360.1 protein of unknown function DUF664 [Actinosynnema mirum DSM 43827]AXX32958.1 protein of unknown function DUF664 [Actinosynnema pretiosum subsp. pretiosum]QUF03182.1 DinB family protein [Actinosynnema pretiosum subsp. pretiosum]
MVGDERVWPEAAADDELRLALEFLDFLRLTVVGKVDGLSRELAVRAPLPTSPVVSPLGVVKHLVAVERWWVSIIAGGSGAPELWGADADASWLVAEEDTVGSVLAAYREEWALGARSLAGLRPGDPVRGAAQDDLPGRTVRWVLSHVAQETARHAGQLDLLRELADGEKGE